MCGLPQIGNMSEGCCIVHAVVGTSSTRGMNRSSSSNSRMRSQIQDLSAFSSRAEPQNSRDCRESRVWIGTNQELHYASHRPNGNDSV